MNNKNTNCGKKVKTICMNCHFQKSDKTKSKTFMKKNKERLQKHDERKYMSLLIKNDRFLMKYKAICDKIGNSIKKEFDSKPIHNDKYVKTKVKSHNGKINIDFHDSGMSQDGYRCIF